MSEDRTTPMQQPQWSRRDTDPDDQQTVFADQEGVTPPTIPLGDQGGGGWQPPPDPGFQRTDPASAGAPPPYAPQQAPFAPPPAQAQPPAGGEGVIGERCARFPGTQVFLQAVQEFQSLGGLGCIK